MNWGKGVGVGQVVGGVAGVTERGAGSCLRGCDGEGRGGDRGSGEIWWAGSWPSTPHLTSPLEGGRDELGEAV